MQRGPLRCDDSAGGSEPEWVKVAKLSLQDIYPPFREVSYSDSTCRQYRLSIFAYAHSVVAQSMHDISASHSVLKMLNAGQLLPESVLVTPTQILRSTGWRGGGRGRRERSRMRSRRRINPWSLRAPNPPRRGLRVFKRV